jgi:hypothetical protein
LDNVAVPHVNLDKLLLSSAMMRSSSAASDEQWQRMESDLASRIGGLKSPMNDRPSFAVKGNFTWLG